MAERAEMSKGAILPVTGAYRRGLGTGTSALLLVISVICLAAGRGVGVTPQQWVDHFALVPAQAWQFGEAYKLFSYSLLHLDTWHWLQNAIGLAVFGRIVERQTSSMSMILLVVAGAILAGAAHTVVYPTSTLPLMGFSGAVAALIGAALMRSVPLAWLRWVLVSFAYLTVCALGLAVIRGNLPNPLSGDPAHVAHLVGLAVGIVVVQVHMMIKAFATREKPSV